MAKTRWTNHWPVEYLHDAKINKSIEEVWEDLDNYSWEETYEEKADLHKCWHMVVAVPPLKRGGKFVKGVFFSVATRALIEKYPKLRELFFVCANSMFCSYPHNHQADYFFACYDNPAHEKWYKEKYPSAKRAICLPLQDSDWLDERMVKPVLDTKKTIDVFCVTSPFPVKNLPIFAKALKIYEEKYHRRLRVVYALGGREMKKRADGSLDYSEAGDYIGGVLKEVDRLLGDTKSYIDFIPYIEYKEIPKYYSAAKCCVLGSLIEGKNRFIGEAMACGTPIVVFRDFNKYMRGDYPVFFEDSGEYVPEFTAESLADTIHKVIENPEKYDARGNYLKHFGRKNFVNTVVDMNPYYRENLPNYQSGKIFENTWVDKACREQYGVSFEDFVYSKKVPWQHVAGEEDIEGMVKRYFKLFM